MSFKLLKSRRGRLQHNLERLFDYKLNAFEIRHILTLVDNYEKNNLETIEKLKKHRRAKISVEINKINGALKQTINAHGPITKALIGSAGKRIYGALLVIDKEVTLVSKILKWLRIKK